MEYYEEEKMENESEVKVCKKCHKELPVGYKYNECESCRNNQTHILRNIVKGAAGVVGAAAIALAVIVNNKKK